MIPVFGFGTTLILYTFGTKNFLKKNLKKCTKKHLKFTIDEIKSIKITIEGKIRAFDQGNSTRERVIIEVLE